MGEMADILLSSSDPYDEFERATRGGSECFGGTYAVRDFGILEAKQPLFARIDGKDYRVTGHASEFLKYIRIGSYVHFRHWYGSNEIYYIKLANIDRR